VYVADRNLLSEDGNCRGLKSCPSNKERLT
jgi:hypothetical protein